MKLRKTFITVAAILVLLVAGILSGCVPPVPEVIDVTGVDITEDDQSMKVDETLQLTAVVTPENATDKDITWESDNPDVAAADENGLVTALSAGVANITVTTDDGAFADSVKITVTSQPSGGGSTPAPKKYEVSFGVFEEVFEEDNNILTAGLNSRLIRDGEEPPVPQLAGVEIKIFSDEEKTNSVAVITTDDEGMATAKLPAGTYYYTASAEGYICFPYISDDEILSPLPSPEESFSLPLEDDDKIILIIAAKTYLVTFQASDALPTGLARETNNPFLENVIIEISVVPGFSYSINRGDDNLSESEPFTIITDENGIAEIYLPNGSYIYTATLDGYEVIDQYPLNTIGNDEYEFSSLVSRIPMTSFVVNNDEVGVGFVMNKIKWTVTFWDFEAGDDGDWYNDETSYVYNTVIVEDGATISSNYIGIWLTKDGYSARGWYTINTYQADSSYCFDWDTPIKNNTDLYAQYYKNVN